MKIKKIILLLLIAIFSTAGAFSQQSGDSRDIIIKAMKDELNRNMDGLKLGQLSKPFFISYNFHNFKVFYVKSKLGEIIQSREYPLRDVDTRVLVGDYKLTQENYYNRSSWYRYMYQVENLPLADDYDGIRQVLWRDTDYKYKDAAETFEKKLSVIKQQNFSKEETLNDLFKIPVVNKLLPEPVFTYQKNKWESIAKDISAVFRDYPEIYNSEVMISFIYGEEIIANSEGSVVSWPFTLAAVQVNAETQAEDGEPLNDQVLYFEKKPDVLPAHDQIKKEVMTMAENLVSLRSVKPFDDYYVGPVLFEGQAVGELFSQTLFSGKRNLIANRQLIYGDPRSLYYSDDGTEGLDDKIGKKIVSHSINVSSEPYKTEFNGKQLIGTNAIDMECAEPAENLSIIKDGKIVTLLNNRTPTRNIDKSNGFERINFGGNSIGSDIAPGVIDISFSTTYPQELLKKKLIEKAKKEGLEYAIIVRKLNTPCSRLKTGANMSSVMNLVSGNKKKDKISNPIAIYMVSVRDGKETRIRSASFEDFSIKSLRRAENASKEKFAYNTMYLNRSGYDDIYYSTVYYSSSEGMDLYGSPASFIVPNSVLFDELELEKEKRLITSKLPAVDSPVSD